jgi:Zn-dependent protease
MMKALIVFGAFSEPVFMLLYHMLTINLILALFNLIPFPPLDGSKVLQGLLPARFSNIYSIFEQNPWLSLVGFFVIIKFAWVVIGPPYNALLNGLLGLFGINL